MGTLDLDLGICRIRPFRWGDEESIARLADDREVWLNLRDRFPRPYTLDDARGWIDFLSGLPDPTHFAIEADGRAVGSIGFEPGEDVHRRSAEVGYWLGREFWGRGIATAAVRAVTSHAFESTGLIRLQACVFGWNPASARVLEKAGYAFEGRLRDAVIKDGRTTDALLYAIVRGDQWPSGSSSGAGR